ncbi:MAG: sugar nucleotide-binding protein [Actinobacteria bacterium]|nr:sugar nucleotide-binding protein [Actinomycetota bacterium]
MSSGDNYPSMVIGATGLVGSWLMSNLPEGTLGTYYSQPSPGYTHLDIRDSQAVDKLICSAQPVVIYCPAARPGVDFCEEHPQESYAINVAGIENVARSARKIDALMVFFSSDYIFDGRDGPYCEFDAPNPICIYGQHKLQAERLVADLLPDSHVIARITVVYGWESAGKNFVFRLVHSLRNSRSVRVPSDQVGSPTYAPSLTAAAIELAQRQLVGTWHISGPRCMDRYEFAILVAETFELDASLIQPVTTDQLQQIAPRPLLAGMKTSKARKALKTELVAPASGLRDMCNTETICHPSR